MISKMFAMVTVSNSKSCWKIKLILGSVSVLFTLCLTYYIHGMPNSTTMYSNFQLDRLSSEVSTSITSSTLNVSDEITVVTAYWNLGRFLKGGGTNFFDTPLYHKWANVFRYILNPMVIYTDSEDFLNMVKSFRNTTKYRTRVFLVNRQSSWAFQRLERIKAIYSTPGYPKYHPNTVVPGYSCAQHAKYDVVKRASVRNYFRTKYFTWLDVGLFRSRKSTNMFHLVKPADFNDSLVAMTEVGIKNDNAPINMIVRTNMVWVCGCLFLGRYDVMILHADEYKRAVDYFLSRGLMNTDQQILYGMYSSEGIANIKPKINIQTYRALNDWFFLGYKMVQEVNAAGGASASILA